MRRCVVVLAALSWMSSVGVQADVIESSDHGFVTRNEVTVEAPARAVYQALTQVARWWNPDHSFFGDAGNLVLEARAGGCFCERLPDGRSVEHLRVVHVVPNAELRLVGGLGPLQEMAVNGVMVWRLTENEGRTTITLHYSVGGYRPGGLGELAEPVDGVLLEQLTRLKAHIDTLQRVAR